MTSCFLGDRPGTCLADAVRATTVLLQPIGAFEHHGPRLPLHTDAIVVDELARVLVRDRPLGLMVLPTLSYGLSSEHVWAPGTVSLNPATLLAVLDDIAGSAVRAGAARLALLNDHGGNTHLLRVACREMRVRHRLLTFLLQPALPPDNGGPPRDSREEGLGIHGGLGETSLPGHASPDGPGTAARLVTSRCCSRSSRAAVHVRLCLAPPAVRAARSAAAPARRRGGRCRGRVVAPSDGRGS